MAEKEDIKSKIDLKEIKSEYHKSANYAPPRLQYRPKKIGGGEKINKKYNIYGIYSLITYTIFNDYRKLANCAPQLQYRPKKIGGGTII